jgi:hypothetical protein
MHISAPKRLAVVVNIKILFSTNLNIFLKLRYVSLIYGKHKKFSLPVHIATYGNVIKLFTAVSYDFS